MNQIIARMIKTYDTLSTADKKEFMDFIKKRESGTPMEKAALNEHFVKSHTINFSPGPNSCPTCGR